MPRVLKRHQCRFLADESGAVYVRPLPQVVGPDDPQWNWPEWIDNSLDYARYVVRLQRERGLSAKVPLKAFVRFAKTHQDYGWEVLTRAAALATSVSRHPFSPRFLTRFLDKVPGKPNTQRLF